MVLLKLFELIGTIFVAFSIDLSINPSIIDCGVFIIPRFLLPYKQQVVVSYKYVSRQYYSHSWSTSFSISWYGSYQLVLEHGTSCRFASFFIEKTKLKKKVILRFNFWNSCFSFTSLCSFSIPQIQNFCSKPTHPKYVCLKKLIFYANFETLKFVTQPCFPKPLNLNFSWWVLGELLLEIVMFVLLAW